MNVEDEDLEYLKVCYTNKQLQKQIERMKCCMNCEKWRYDYEHYPLCAEKVHFTSCEKWEMKV